MRKIVLSAALSASALALTACGGADTTTDETAVAEADAGADTTTAATETSVLDPNTATAEELAAATGMTAELADAVIAGRPYESATAFNATLMDTLGEEEAAAVRAGVFVPVNLNTATKEDIELIPGMTPKMVHEFEEYRPYADMAEFDREIGKYVDEAEVARFRQYVTL
ncbi:ComEA family DNA-binding protein [Altererythrobacter sp. CAU 1778]